ncbi:MAG: hypothetical protein ACLFMW_05505 [Ectothiorhodospira sp.]
MATRSPSLMKLVSLTRGNEEITPLLADYIQRKYHVKDISTFISQPVEGVEDKDALYEQWAQWIEEDQLENFMIDNPPIEETGSDPERPALRSVPSSDEMQEDPADATEEPPMETSGEAEEALFRSHMEGAEALMDETQPHEEAAIAEAMEEAREMETALEEEAPGDTAETQGEEGNGPAADEEMAAMAEKAEGGAQEARADEDDLMAAMMAEGNTAEPRIDDARTEEGTPAQEGEDPMAALMTEDEGATAEGDTAQADEDDGMAAMAADMEVQTEPDSGAEEDTVAMEQEVEQVPPGEEEIPETTTPQENPMPPQSQPAAEATPSAAAAGPDGGVEGAIRALVQAELQQEIARLPQPEPPVSEDRIREIVREEVKALLRNLFS